MAGVNKEGTGARAFAGAQYTSGGKTGTAQVIAMKQNEKYDESKVDERHRDHSLFIAFAPLESPKIALAVIVENGGFGARAAAPIARTVLDYFLLGKLPHGHAAADAGGRGRGRQGERLMELESTLHPAPRRPARSPRASTSTLLMLMLTLSMLGLAALFSASYENPARVAEPAGQPRRRADRDVDRGADPAADADALGACRPTSSASRFLVAVALFGDVVNGARAGCTSA